MKRTIRAQNKLVQLDIAWGLIVLATGIGMVWFSPSRKPYEQIFTFVRDFLFLNLTHVFFTFILLAVLPGARKALSSWTKHLSNNDKFIFFSITILIALLLFVSGAHYPADSMIGEALKFIVIPIALFVPFYHSVRQHYGLMLYYFSKRSRVLEVGHYVILLLYFSCLLLSSGGELRYGSLWLPISGEAALKWQNALTLIMFLTAALICCDSLRGYKEAGINKFLYSMRFFIYPIASHTSLAGYLIGMIHGIEYTLFLVPLLVKQVGKAAALRAGFRILLVLTPLGLLMMSFMLFYPFNHSAPVSIQILSMVYFTFLYLHYLIDSLLFRFSRNENASFLSQLRTE